MKQEEIDDYAIKKIVWLGNQIVEGKIKMKEVELNQEMPEGLVVVETVSFSFTRRK